MRYQLYNQNIIDRKHAAFGIGIPTVAYFLAPYLVTTITNNQTALPSMEYLDVPKTDENWYVNYVIAYENFASSFNQNFAFFVNRKSLISQNVIRLYLTLDTVSTFFTSETVITNGYIKRTNDSKYITANKTLSIEDINSPRNLTILKKISESYKYILVIIEVTSGARTGEIIYTITQPPTDVYNFILDMAEVDGYWFEPSSGSSPQPSKIKILHYYLLPEILQPTVASTGVGRFYKGNTATAQAGLYYDKLMYINGVGRRQVNIPEIRPENNYRIGTFSNYLELKNPSEVASIDLDIVGYSDTVGFKCCIGYNGEEYDITNGLELPLIDSVQANYNLQQKSNAVIANVLSLLGQGIVTAGAFVGGNYLAGLLGTNNLVNSGNGLNSLLVQRAGGGVSYDDNSGLINLARGAVLVIQKEEPLSSEYATLIEKKGYVMLKSFMTFKPSNGCYYEIIADEINVPLAYQADIEQRLQNGVYFVVDNDED